MGCAPSNAKGDDTAGVATFDATASPKRSAIKKPGTSTSTSSAHMTFSESVGSSTIASERSATAATVVNGSFVPGAEGSSISGGSTTDPCKKSVTFSIEGVAEPILPGVDDGRSPGSKPIPGDRKMRATTAEEEEMNRIDNSVDFISFGVCPEDSAGGGDDDTRNGFHSPPPLASIPSQGHGGDDGDELALTSAGDEPAADENGEDRDSHGGEGHTQKRRLSRSTTPQEMLHERGRISSPTTVGEDAGRVSPTPEQSREGSVSGSHPGSRLASPSLEAPPSDFPSSDHHNHQHHGNGRRVSFSEDAVDHHRERNQTSDVSSDKNDSSDTHSLLNSINAPLKDQNGGGGGNRAMESTSTCGISCSNVSVRDGSMTLNDSTVEALASGH